jgi:hypothetical protein
MPRVTQLKEASKFDDTPETIMSVVEEYVANLADIEDAMIELRKIKKSNVELESRIVLVLKKNPETMQGFTVGTHRFSHFIKSRTATLKPDFLKEAIIKVCKTTAEVAEEVLKEANSMRPVVRVDSLKRSTINENGSRRATSSLSAAAAPSLNESNVELDMRPGRPEVSAEKRSRTEH